MHQESGKQGVIDRPRLCSRVRSGRVGSIPGWCRIVEPELMADE